MKCALCERNSKYQIRRIRSSTWIDVCSVHNTFIGIENLESFGMTHKEARELNKEIMKGEEKNVTIN